MRNILSVLVIALLALTTISVLLFLNFKFEWGKNESISTALDIITVTTAVLGAMGIILQLKREKSLKEVEFIVNFNNKFVEIDDLMEVHDVCSEQIGQAIDGKNKGKPLNHTSVYKYLDCFEPLYFLIKNKAVSIDKLYDLVSYRFFIVVNNREVQEKVIAPNEPSYRNIIEMYKILNNYRIKKNLLLPFLTFEKYDLLKFLDIYKGNISSEFYTIEEIKTK